jgi:hypothetical protein
VPEYKKTDLNTADFWLGFVKYCHFIRNMPALLFRERSADKPGSYGDIPGPAPGSSAGFQETWLLVIRMDGLLLAVPAVKPVAENF